MQIDIRQTTETFSQTAAALAALVIAWLILPHYGPWITACLWAATLISAPVMVWHLVRPARSSVAAARDQIPAAADPADEREFADFVLDGIVKSQLRGRTAALMTYHFVIPPSRNHFANLNFNEIVEEFRDMTRAYDRVHNAGGGEIHVFLAHLPLDAEPDLIAARLLDDVRRMGGAANLASQVDCGWAAYPQDGMTSVTLAEHARDRRITLR